MTEKEKQINSTEIFRCIELWNRDIKPNIFIPSSVSDIENLEVAVEEINTNDQKELWWSAIVMMSSWINQKVHPGRNTSWFVKTKNGKYLGILRLSGEVTGGQSRDKEIGWSDHNKYKDNKIQNSTNLQAVIPFRSFGNNCLGGKLLTKLTQTPEIITRFDKIWELTTVLLTVISLNPCPCQYNSISNWKNVGNTASGKPTFFCPLYSNYKDFLCSRITKEQLIPNGNLIEVKEALNWWKLKAIERFKKQSASGKPISEEIYFDSLYTKGDPTYGFFNY